MCNTGRKNVFAISYRLVIHKAVFETLDLYEFDLT